MSKLVQTERAYPYNEYNLRDGYYQIEIRIYRHTIINRSQIAKNHITEQEQKHEIEGLKQNNYERQIKNNVLIRYKLT